MKSAGEGQPMKRTARMFDDRATPRSPFVVAYSPRSHPDTPTDSSLSSTLRPRFAIFDWLTNLSNIKLYITTSDKPTVCLLSDCYYLHYLDQRFFLAAQNQEAAI
jgi:hypothetical protein